MSAPRGNWGLLVRLSHYTLIKVCGHLCECVCVRERAHEYVTEMNVPSILCWKSLDDSRIFLISPPEGCFPLFVIKLLSPSPRPISGCQAKKGFVPSYICRLQGKAKGPGEGERDGREQGNLKTEFKVSSSH